MVLQRLQVVREDYAFSKGCAGRVENRKSRTFCRRGFVGESLATHSGQMCGMPRLWRSNILFGFDFILIEFISHLGTYRIKTSGHSYF